MASCLSNVLKLGCIGTVLVIAVSIAMAQQNGLGWAIGALLGLALIAKVFFRS